MKTKLIELYLILNIISTYNFNGRLHLLLLIQILTVFFFIFSLKEIISEKKIHLNILLIVLVLILSMLFNYNEFFKYIINIFVVLTSYYLVRYYQKEGKSITDTIIKNMIFFTIINLLIIIFLPGIKANSKEIFGITFSRSYSEYLGIAIASINAGFVLIEAKRYKNKLIRYFLMSISLFVIFNSGKLSVIFTIFITMVFKIISKRISKKNLINLLRYIIYIFFLGNYIYLKTEIYLEKYIDTQKILTGRVILWKDYTNYIFTKGNLILGNGFFSSEKMISYLNHPHNMYLSILYILGVLGGIIYIMFFTKIIKNIILKSDFNKKSHFEIVIYILFLMNTDDYFILTVYPIYILIFIDNLIKDDKNDK